MQNGCCGSSLYTKTSSKGELRCGLLVPAIDAQGKKLMAIRQLTFAGGAYDRTQALIDGTVKPEGLELNWLTLPYLEIWKRMLNYYDFDASELSFSSYLIARSGGKPLIAIPVFPARAFRHSYIFVNTKSGIEKPEDLVGKRIGVADFQQTATVWMRGILQHEYGVDLDKIQWLIWEKESRVAISLPKRYNIHIFPLEKNLMRCFFTANSTRLFMRIYFRLYCAQIIFSGYSKTTRKWK